LKPTTSAPPSQSFISRLFGIKAPSPVKIATRSPEEVVTPLDLIRQQATEAYEAMLKYIDEHGQEILEEDKKREEQFMIEQQKTSIVGFFGRLLGGPPHPPPKEKE